MVGCGIAATSEFCNSALFVSEEVSTIVEEEVRTVAAVMNDSLSVIISDVFRREDPRAGRTNVALRDVSLAEVILKGCMITFVSLRRRMRRNMIRTPQMRISSARLPPTADPENTAGEGGR